MALRWILALNNVAGYVQYPARSPEESASHPNRQSSPPPPVASPLPRPPPLPTGGRGNQRRGRQLGDGEVGGGLGGLLAPSGNLARYQTSSEGESIREPCFHPPTLSFFFFLLLVGPIFVHNNGTYHMKNIMQIIHMIKN